MWGAIAKIQKCHLVSALHHDQPIILFRFSFLLYQTFNLNQKGVGNVPKVARCTPQRCPGTDPHPLDAD